MYRDGEVTILRRYLECETSTIEVITSEINQVLAWHDSPYRVSEVDLSDYPGAIQVRVTNDDGREPDEDSLHLKKGGYEEMSIVREDLASMFGARWVGFPGWYWAK